jgi:hypothetical protein
MDGAATASAFDYPALMTEALTGLVRRVLARVAEDGLPGEHHFFLTFGTSDDGVDLPAALRRQFPDEMTIVLQHQFWNLTVDDAAFAVTLRFGGKPERVVVPWSALRAFADPSAEFGFRLRATATDPTAADGEGDAASRPAPVRGASEEAGERSKVVDIGPFRRRSPPDADR